MTQRTRTTWILGLLAALGVMSAGCGTAKRFITVNYWHDAQTLYVAYSEDDGGYAAKVLMCHRNDDNTMKCAPQEDLNKTLNAD